MILKKIYHAIKPNFPKMISIGFQKGKECNIFTHFWLGSHSGLNLPTPELMLPLLLGCCENDYGNKG